MNVAQLEYADAYTDPLPTWETIERMRRLFIDYDAAQTRLDRKEAAIRATKRLFRCPAPTILLENEANQLALRVMEIRREIVEVARQIVAEADNQELIGERNTE